MLTSKMRTQWLSPAGLLIIWHLNIGILILDLLNIVIFILNIVKLNIVILILIIVTLNIVILNIVILKHEMRIFSCLSENITLYGQSWFLDHLNIKSMDLI